MPDGGRDRPLPGRVAAPRWRASSSTPLERRLWGIPGVEYLYSTSRPGAAFITVRFKVNEPLEPSLVKVHQELAAHPEAAARPARCTPVVRRAHHRRRPVPHPHAARERGAPRRASCASSPRRSRGSSPTSRGPRRCGCSAARGARSAIEPDPERLRTLVGLARRAAPGAPGARRRSSRRARWSTAAAASSWRRTGFARSAAELAAGRGGRPRRPADLRGGRGARRPTGPSRSRRWSSRAAKGQPGFEQAVSIVGREARRHQRHRARRPVLAKVGGAARAAAPGLGRRRRSPATTARRPARSRTSSSSTSSSRRSR